MIEWWNSLTGVNQGFYIAAAVLSLIFIWQFISAMVGLSGGEGDVDIEADTDIDADGMDLDNIEAHSLEEAGESIAAFKVLSLRAILAFLMLFCWAAGMYLNTDTPLSRALLYATGWGLGAWVVVTLLVNLLRRLAETGTARLSTCVGGRGMVYLNIPAGGQGEVRVAVSGTISLVKARATGGGEIKAGTAVRVVRMLDQMTVEVRPVEAEENGKEEDQ